MSEGNYRLKQEVITGFMRQRMPTLCETEKPLKWWLDNKIVPNDEDLEPCDGKNADARTEPSINYDGLLGTVDYKYEHLFISDEGELCPIDGWMPIATERIKHPEKIPEYIERGRLRLIKPQ